MSYNKKIIENNIERINYFQKLKRTMIDMIISDSYTEISKICDLREDIDNDFKKNNKIIGVYKNGLNAGQVYFCNNKDISSNSHYLSLNNENFLIEYVYYILDHYELKLKELSNLTTQTNLAKSSLLTFKIPILTLDKQKEIVKHCDDFEEQILNLNLNTKNLNSKDIMEIMSKICSL